MSAPQLQTTRDELRVHLGTNEDDLPDADADLLINRSFWGLQNSFPFKETEITKTFPTVEGTRLYSVPTMFEAIKQLSIEDLISGAHQTVTLMTTYEYENVYFNNENKYGKPEKYLREDACIRLWPTPDDEYTMILKYYKLIDDFDMDHLDFPLPQNWWEILLYGAVWRGWLRLKNTSAAVDMKNQQVALIKDVVPSESREMADTKMAAFLIAGYNPDDIYGLPLE